VGTRLQKLEENNWDGIILAHAGLLRLGIKSLKKSLKNHPRKRWIRRLNNLNGYGETRVQNIIITNYQNMKLLQLVKLQNKKFKK
jgi:hypothetical protein